MISNPHKLIGFVACDAKDINMFCHEEACLVYESKEKIYKQLKIAGLSGFKVSKATLGEITFCLENGAAYLLDPISFSKIRGHFPHLEEVFNNALHDDPDKMHYLYKPSH